MKVRWLSVIATSAFAAGIGNAQSLPPNVVPAAPAPAATSSPAVPALIMDNQPPRVGMDIGTPTASCPSPAASDKAPAPFTPFMLGDFIGPVANLFTDFKIAEGESPRPTDRVFFKYNYYNNINPSRWTDPTEPIHNVNLDLYTFGAEKTLFDGLMSVGVRMPFYTMDAEGKDFHIGPDPVSGAAAVLPGGPGFTETKFGNLIGIAKVVIWEDRPTGDLLSGGLVVSIPTLGSQKLDPGLSTLMYMQPFSGFILTSGDFFVQGFASMTLPVARPESIVSFNDVGVGYWMYRDATCSRFISGVAPTVEIHYTAPIRNPDPGANLYGNFVDNQRVHNTVDFTFGATLLFTDRATLGLGVAVPVTGERPFDVEGQVQLNMLF